jgi:hypothetical protein
MPWPLILLTPDEFLSRLNLSTDRRLAPGHCAYAPQILRPGHYIGAHLGSRYLSLPEPRRAPILIALPDCVNGRYQLWCPDEMAWNAKDGYHGAGWTITGDLPNIAITPSINCVGSYHGFVSLIDGKGVITDDCEGRKFPLAPAP